jgi:hypothetical protein
MNRGMTGKAADENRSLATRSGIRPAALKRSQYTLSLLAEGQRTGLLDSRDVSGVQHQFLLLLHNLIRRHTQGESSSVTTETAEGLLASAMYAVDAYLWSMQDPEKAIACLKTTDIVTLHAEGVEHVRQRLEETKRLYHKVKTQKLDVPVDAYNTTIDESLPIFIKKYNILFDARNTMASIDYPLAVDDMSLQGVFYIKQYLEHLRLENQFCRQWEREDVLRLLKNLGRVCKFDFRIELFNIFELVFQHALFSVLAGGDARSILMTPYQYERLERMFTDAGASTVGTMIDKAIDRLLEQLPAQEPGTKPYMKTCCRDLVRRIVNAAENRQLQAVILTNREEAVKPFVLTLDTEDRMSDVRLRRLLDDIMRSESKEEKVRIIREHFSSLHDVLDLLESDCLYGDEYEALYAELGDMDLAILCKIVFYEELRGAFVDLHDVIQEKQEAERDWQNRLIAFLKRLDDSRIRAIDEWIGNIDYEQLHFY